MCESQEPQIHSFINDKYNCAGYDAYHWLRGCRSSIQAETTRHCERLLKQKAAVVGSETQGSKTSVGCVRDSGPWAANSPIPVLSKINYPVPAGNRKFLFQAHAKRKPPRPFRCLLVCITWTIPICLNTHTWHVGVHDHINDQLLRRCLTCDRPQYTVIRLPGHLTLNISVYNRVPIYWWRM